MKIIELRASNVKRLKAIEITPDGTMQIIGGRNAQGKSSVLDAIWLALGGGKASKDTAKPIRDGETRASVTLDLGGLVVTRSWTTKGTSLKVASGDGATFSSPQAMLDELVGQLSFDPLEFTRLSPKWQRDTLLDLVNLDVDVDQLDAQRADLFAQRTDIGRQGKAIGTVTVDEDLPAEEQSAQSVIAQIRKAQEIEREHSRLASAIRDWDAGIVRQKDHIAHLELELVTAREGLIEQQAAREQDAAELAKIVIPEVASLEQSLSTIEQTNAAIRANNEARTKASQRDELRQQYSALTEQIAAVDEAKTTALASARFPVEGLGFDADGVTFQGIPFTQASSAEQIRVSLAMAMALNPKLRVLRIKDGSLLDTEALQQIRDQVEKKDFQLWIERVGDSDEGAVIIEDGAVA